MFDSKVFYHFFLELFGSTFSFFGGLYNLAYPSDGRDASFTSTLTGSLLTGF